MKTEIVSIINPQTSFDKYISITFPVDIIEVYVDWTNIGKDPYQVLVRSNMVNDTRLCTFAESIERITTYVPSTDAITKNYIFSSMNQTFTHVLVGEEKNISNIYTFSNYFLVNNNPRFIGGIFTLIFKFIQYN